MARVKLTEFRAKTLLIRDYQGIAIGLDSLSADTKKLSKDTGYIIKVDQGVKKRGKQGLIRLNVDSKGIAAAVKELASKGFTNFLAEPMIDHESHEERYLSVERVRDGLRILYSEHGGVEIEDNPDSVQKFSNLKDVPLPQVFLNHLNKVMDEEYFSFVEINPLLVRGERCLMLDCAVLVDSAGRWRSNWEERDVAEARAKTSVEQKIAELNDNSPASFSFRLLNPNGSIWFLLSGGGASITIADEASNRHKADLIGNYGEYSGGPTREETQVYTDLVLQQLFMSDSEKKAIVIAGGVANFTDVKKTFAGIIDALKSELPKLKQARTKVFVRRGGPNELEGLKMMEEFLRKNDIFGSVHGSSDVLTVVVDEALRYVHV